MALPGNMHCSALYRALGVFTLETKDLRGFTSSDRKRREQILNVQSGEIRIKAAGTMLSYRARDASWSRPGGSRHLACR